mmetsp:Transcript_2137/g.7772  ORF Transcript_2137/g.7772 Transcript_2137/m.7772 type:complete len:243 (-) Transcript_2137:1452-2180(-)
MEQQWWSCASVQQLPADELPKPPKRLLIKRPLLSKRNNSSHVQSNVLFIYNGRKWRWGGNKCIDQDISTTTRPPNVTLTTGTVWTTTSQFEIPSVFCWCIIGNDSAVSATGALCSEVCHFFARDKQFLFHLVKWSNSSTGAPKAMGNPPQWFSTPHETIFITPQRWSFSIALCFIVASTSKLLPNGNAVSIKVSIATFQDFGHTVVWSRSAICNKKPVCIKSISYFIGLQSFGHRLFSIGRQ